MQSQKRNEVEIYREGQIYADIDRCTHILNTEQSSKYLHNFKKKKNPRLEPGALLWCAHCLNVSFVLYYIISPAPRTLSN